MKSVVQFAIVIAAALGLSLLIKHTLATPNNTSGDPSPLLGKAAPEFTLKNLSDKPVKLSEQKGKVVVLDFWATWCIPCRESLPHLQAVHANKELAEKGLVILAMNNAEKPETVDKFIKGNNYTFNVLLDADGAVANSYAVKGFPTTIIVGRDGNVKSFFEGYDESVAKNIDAAVNAALAEKAAN